jgi:carboxylesterase type B
MVWIHGGAFLTGSNDPFMYGPEYFYSQTKQNDEVILVTINYRLGVLGFLSLENKIAPGNLGLRDQNLALQWVSKHISNFGGDPNKVTLFGLSAGAQSTNYHILSPLSTYLFDQVRITPFLYIAYI